MKLVSKQHNNEEHNQRLTSQINQADNKSMLASR